MIGSELAAYPGYLLDRAAEELSVRFNLAGWQLRAAELFVRLMGVPELGVRVRLQHALRSLPQDVGSLIDLGCGSGMLLGAVARHKRFGRLAGIEIDAESVGIARETHPYAEIHQTTVEAAPADMTGAFDFGVCIDVLEHLNDANLDAFLARSLELLKPGGTLIVHVPCVKQKRHFASFQNWSHHDHVREGFAQDDLIRRIIRGGFEIGPCRPTFGWLTSLFWELNMLAAGRSLQAIVFPVSLLICSPYERLAGRSGNGVLCVARRPL
jgi:SAM-dependent methyltransferase